MSVGRGRDPDVYDDESIKLLPTGLMRSSAMLPWRLRLTATRFLARSKSQADTIGKGHAAVAVHPVLHIAAHLPHCLRRRSTGTEKPPRSLRSSITVLATLTLADPVKDRAPV